MKGTVYLLHFDKPYHHARHYTGFTTSLDARLQAHSKGTGARLMEVITGAGISFQLARAHAKMSDALRSNTTRPGFARCVERTTDH